LANIGRDYDENSLNELEERGKKLDKMKYAIYFLTFNFIFHNYFNTPTKRYFASVGKRNSYDGSYEMEERAKKMDKMKYE